MILSLENNLINITFGLLLVNLIIYWVNLIMIKSIQMQQAGYSFNFIANLCLTIFLLSRWLKNHYFPLSNLYESLLFLTWCFTFIHLILEYKNKSKLIGSISTPISLFTISFASFTLPIEMQMATPLVPALRSNWLVMHVSIMMLSYATLITGCLLSILFLVLSYGKQVKLQGNSYSNNNIQNLQFDYLTYNQTDNYSLSSLTNKYRENKINILQKIDTLSYRIIGLGFPLLTIGIISGAVWANEAWGTYWSWDPKETWALITWLIFAVYLHSRLNQSWQGKKPAILASLGFIIVWVCYLGVNFLGKGLHSYGWVS
uniref:Cytochrome c biogenesis protein CcsA n=1 Tax=Crouania attenuata TaxID=42002 RepID=A0A4D6WRQ7_9FLOR|nr:cytochrome c biogenesis protein ccs1 [Crouania attenuata]